MRLGLCFLFTAALLPARADSVAPVTVSAAVSLTEAMQAAAEDYASTGGGPVRFNFGPSNALARQIVAGAPVDVFVSADQAQMDVVARAGRVVDGSRVDLLRNQLAIVVPDDRRRTLAGIRDLLEPSFRRIAIGDPAAVPAGVYAKQYLQAAGVWKAIEPRLVPCASVRATLASVDQGSADAGIVYATDVRAAAHSVVAWLVPVDRGPRIVYPAALIRDAPAPQAARRFLDYLRSSRATRIFVRYGFLPYDH